MTDNRKQIISIEKHDYQKMVLFLHFCELHEVRIDKVMFSDNMNTFDFFISEEYVESRILGKWFFHSLDFKFKQMSDDDYRKVKLTFWQKVFGLFYSNYSK